MRILVNNVSLILSLSQKMKTLHHEREEMKSAKMSSSTFNTRAFIDIDIVT